MSMCEMSGRGKGGGGRVGVKWVCVSLRLCGCAWEPVNRDVSLLGWTLLGPTQSRRKPVAKRFANISLTTASDLKSIQ